MSLAMALTLGGCGFFNPYVRVADRLIFDGVDHFCWAAVGAPDDKSSCQPEQAAGASLSECLNDLRSTATIRTTENEASNLLDGCMRGKGWQRLCVSECITLS